MSRIDTAAVQAAQAAQPDRQQAEAKQRKWLFELEHALLAMGMKKERAPQRGADDAPPQRAHAQDKHQMAQEEVPQAVQAAAPAKAATALDTQGGRDNPAVTGLPRPVAATAPATAVGGAAAPGQAASVASAAGMAPAAAASHAALAHAAPSLHTGAVDGAAAQDFAAGNAGTVADSQAAQPGTAAAAGMDAKAAADVTPAVAVQPPAAHTAVAPSLSLAALAPQRGAAGGGAVNGVDSALQALRPARAGALLTAPGMGTAQQQQEPDALPEPAMEQAEASLPQEAAPQQADAEPFEKRLMHLYHGADGVQAWIRDVELNAAQARALAQVLASELGGNGARLAALTVNGRQILAPEPAEASVLSAPDAWAEDGAADAPEANLIKEI